MAGRGLAALPSNGTLTNYTPTLRERMADALRRTFYSDDLAGQQQAEKVLNFGEAVTPLGTLTGAYDAGRDAGQGNYGLGALQLGMAMIPGARTKGGKLLDATNTGLVFKDVVRPHNLMKKGDWAKVNRANDFQDWHEVELPIGAMNATQHSVNADFGTVHQKNDTLPLVIKKDGQYFVQDGHHRITSDAAKGKQTAKVRLIDIDNTMQADFPLLQFPNK